jgi:hypothetical protein
LGNNQQYLRLGLLGVSYLLPGSTGFSIEKREQFEEADGGSAVVAWHATASGRWPVFSVDADLNPFSRHGWQRAVLLQGRQPIGLVADELQILSPEEVRVEPFRPPGAPPTRVGHLFGGAWVRPGQLPVLMFEPAALAEYLLRLGGMA